MGFKYTVVTDTMFWIGYNVLETPQEVLEAVKEAGYDGIDLPGDPKRMDGKQWRKRVKDVGLDVPELLGAWGGRRTEPGQPGPGQTGLRGSVRQRHGRSGGGNRRAVRRTLRRPAGNPPAALS